MAGRFHNPPGITLMAILFTLAVIRRIDGTPYRLPRYASYDDETQPVAMETSKNSDFAISEPEEPSESAGTSAETKTIRYSKSSESHGDGREESRLLEISQQGRATGLGDVGRTIHESSRRNAPERDDVDDDDDDDDNNNNNNNRGTAEDDLRQLIDAAFEDDIFLSPKKWAAWLAGNGGVSFAKVDKTRPPTPSHNVNRPTTVQQAPSDRIVFPGQYPPSIARRPVPSCVNSTYCQDTPYYLTDAEIDHALNTRYLEPINEPSTISERMGPLDEGNGLCPSMIDTIFPKTAVGDDNEWYYVLNNEKYVQSVRVERCQTENQTCSLIEGFSTGYKTSCKQKYVYRQLVAVSASGNKPVAKPFPMPSSCCCHVKFTGEPEMRFGLSSTKRNRQSPAPERSRN